MIYYSYYVPILTPSQTTEPNPLYKLFYSTNFPRGLIPATMRVISLKNVREKKCIKSETAAIAVFLAAETVGATGRGEGGYDRSKARQLLFAMHGYYLWEFICNNFLSCGRRF